MYEKFGKRFFDLLGSSFSCIMLAPIMIIAALLIKSFDPGPVLFRQNRIGRRGRTFCFYKLRSMPVSIGSVPSDELGEVELTWIGRLMRRTNIDELPQLLNILIGDMSIVGPRAPLPEQRELTRLRSQNGALELRPGLTGLAQINAFDGMTAEEKAQFDGCYASNVSFLGDLKIVIGTFGYLLRPPPIY